MWIKLEKILRIFSVSGLRDCNKDVSSHLKTCKPVNARIENEFQLLLESRYCHGSCQYLLLSSISTSALDFVLFLTSIRIIFRCLGVFISEETHALVMVCPRHRETYGVGWKSGKITCSIPSEMAGHKSSGAVVESVAMSQLSSYQQLKTFLPVETHE